MDRTAHLLRGPLDRNRAHGAAMCGYTVAWEAVRQIDAPSAVFLDGVNRGAAIATTTLVNLIFEAPAVRAG